MSEQGQKSTGADRRDRIFRALRQTPSPTRRAWLARSAGLLALGVAVALAIFGVAGGLRPGPRPPDLILETAVGAACIAALALVGATGRGVHGLGRPRWQLILMIVAIPLLLLGWKVGWSAQDPDMMAQWPERPGMRCLRLSLGMGLGPLLALIWLWRDRDPLHGPHLGAALGIATGASVWVLIDLWCPVAYLPHLLLGHVLPMALMAALGAFLGWRIIAMRRR